MMYDNIPMEELEKMIVAFEYAKNYHFDSYTYLQPALYSFERQKLSKLDINTYIYIADNYKELKEKVKRWKSQTQTLNSL